MAQPAAVRLVRLRVHLPPAESMLPRLSAAVVLLLGCCCCGGGNAAVPSSGAAQLLVVCEPTNDLLNHLPRNLNATRFDHHSAAISAARSGAGDTIMVLADDYPHTPTVLPADFFAAAKAKGAILYVEFPAAVPGLIIGSQVQAGNMTFQRLVVATDALAARGLAKNRLLYAHGAQWLEAGPYAKHHDTHLACRNDSLNVNGSSVETTIEGSWGELCGAAVPCRVRYTGKLCSTPSDGNSKTESQRILWETIQNVDSPSMHWDREHIDSVAKWLGFCGTSPTGLALPEHPCETVASNASGAFCGSCPPPTPAPTPPSKHMIQPILVSARVAGYDTAVFGFNDSGANASPILFQHPEEPTITIATTKLSSFVRGRFAPLAAWKLLWEGAKNAVQSYFVLQTINLPRQAWDKHRPPQKKMRRFSAELLHSLMPWAGGIELEWEASVRPAFAKDAALPSDAQLQASMTGVEWLRGRSGLLPGPKQLARISQFLDPRWVDTTSELSNCSYGECKARLWQPADGKEQGDGRGGILEGYTNLIQADGAQYQVLEFRADCTCESAMAFASYAATATHAHTEHSVLGGSSTRAATMVRVNDSDAVAGRLLDHAFSVGGLQEGAAINGALADGATGLLHWTMGGSNPGGGHSLWGDDNARALLGAMTASGLLKDARWCTQIARAILGNFRAVGVDGFRPVSMNVAQLTGQSMSTYGAANLSGWQDFHAANWSQIDGKDYKDWAFSPHMESYIWAVFLRAFDLTGDEMFLERALRPIATMMAAYPGWAPIANGVQLQKARMLLPLAWLVRVRDTPQHREWLTILADDILRSQQPCGAIREQICDTGWRCTDTSNTPASNTAYGHGEAPLQQTNTDPVTDALYTINFAALGLREAVAATGNATLAKAEAKLAQYLTRIQQRSKARPELDGAWMRAFDFDKWEVWASASDIGWGPWCIECVPNLTCAPAGLARHIPNHHTILPCLLACLLACCARWHGCDIA